MSPRSTLETDEPVIEITEGRHPVVERFIDQPFVPNDLELSDDRRMLVITGPNMGGKSTYMRQVALIVLLWRFLRRVFRPRLRPELPAP